MPEPLNVSPVTSVPRGAEITTLKDTGEQKTNEAFKESELINKARDDAQAEATKSLTGGILGLQQPKEFKNFTDLFEANLKTYFSGKLKKSDKEIKAIMQPQLDILQKKIEEAAKSKIRSSLINPDQLNQIKGIIQNAKEMGTYSDTVFKQALLKRGFQDDEIAALLA